MKKISFLFFVSTLVLTSCQSEVCQCADAWYNMNQEMRKTEAAGKATESVVKKYEQKIDACYNLDAHMSAPEKEQMLDELRECDSYKKIENAHQ